MKYKIKGQEEEVKVFVELWLKRDEDDSSIELRVKLSSWDEDNYNHILKIHPDGSIILSKFVSDKFGFELDDGERIVVNKEV